MRNKLAKALRRIANQMANVGDNQRIVYKRLKKSYKNVKRSK